MELTARLGAVRADMAALGLDALVVPHADEHLGEYLPPRNERLAWLSGFTGSAGVAVVLRERAALFVDGRYTVQARDQVSAERFELLNSTREPHLDWLAAQLPAGAKVGWDPRMHSLRWYRNARQTLHAEGIELVELEQNLIDRNWVGRPSANPDPSAQPALLLPETYTGASSADKRARIAADIAARGADAALLFAPDSVAWLLNLRGNDVPCLPLVLGFGLLFAEDARLLFFTDLAEDSSKDTAAGASTDTAAGASTDTPSISSTLPSTLPSRVPAGFHDHVGAGVTLLPPAAAPEQFAALAGRTVLADPETANAWCQLALERAGAHLLPAPDPVLLPKACKNPVEVEGMRRAHVRDGVAVVRFLAWLEEEVAAGRLHTEAALAERLLALRAEGECFQGPSFATISAAAANAAICHYNHLNAGGESRLQEDSVYLVDSGGQYLDGTTDITRTVAIGDPGAEVRRRFTLVLKGHIAIDRAVFPTGTTGAQLDTLARQFLWREELDYEHGTGHGVGCFLAVHEGPQRIAPGGTCALRPGMVLSNEPGYYQAGAYGMRCENLLVVVPGADDNWLAFDTLTLAPFDTRLVDVELLTPGELDWLNRYHARVHDTLAPLLSGAALDWLRRATLPLKMGRSGAGVDGNASLRSARA